MTPRVRVAVNGKTLYDGQLGEWIQQPPDFVREHIKPGAAPPSAYMKAIMMTMTDAVLRNQSVDIDVRTTARAWQMTVETV